MSFWNKDFLPSIPKSNRWSTRLLAPLDVEDMLDRVRRDFYSPDILRAMSEDFVPRIEVKETDKNIIVSSEIPGMNEDDINVTLRDNNLILEGEKRSEEEKEGKGFYSSEFSYGSFYRSIPLHADVDAEEVNATYKNGILKVKLTKLEENMQKGKRIEIKH